MGEKPEVVVKEPVFESFCGTRSMSEEAIIGKELFNIHCAACHRIYVKGDYTVGFLRRNPEDFAMAYINAEDSLIKVKDKAVLKINREHEGGRYSHKNNFTKSELNSLFAYMRHVHND